LLFGASPLLESGNAKFLGQEMGALRPQGLS
jgi:hypothetical protein